MRKANLLALSALCVVLEKALLMLEEFLKEAVSFEVIVPQVDWSMALERQARIALEIERKKQRRYESQVFAPW